MEKCILQSAGLDLVNINVYAKFHQNIPNGSRVVGPVYFFKIWTSKMCNVRTYVTQVNMMSRVRTYVTYDNL